MKPDVYFNIPKYIKKYGVHAAVEFANFEAAHVTAVKELVEKEKIDCEFTLTRACDVTLDEGLARETEEAFAALKKSGVANLKDVHYTPRKDAERVRTERIQTLSDTILTVSSGFRCQRRFVRIHIYSRSCLALQACHAPLTRRHRKRRQPPDQYPR